MKLTDEQIKEMRSGYEEWISVTCDGCGLIRELRYGYCFDCANNGEERAAKRTVIQHLKKCFEHIKSMDFELAKYDFTWAVMRATRTGDYSKDGYFDKQGHQWRQK